MPNSKKPRVYLDTSIWSFQFHDDSPDRQEITKKFFNQVRQGHYDVYSSGVVINELKAANEPRRSQLLDSFNQISPTHLHTNEEALELCRRYLGSGMLTEKSRNDALHIAIAVVNDIDILLSWNFRHVVKLKTRRIVSGTSRLLGYRDIEICSPQEVIDDDDD